jgi:LysR family glycine cleavage system transcriptional activator
MQHFNQTALAIAAAMHGQGVALVPSLLVQQGLAKGRLTTLWQSTETAQAAYHLVAPKSRKPTQQRRVVALWLLQRARQPPAT